MEREVSISTELAVSLVSLAALLGLVFFFVAQGLFIRDGAGEVITDINESTNVDYVVNLASNGLANEMPAVTAYNILTRYYTTIVESANGVNYATEVNNKYFPYLENRITNLQTTGSDLISDLATLSDRVQLELVDVGGGAYVAFIHPKNSLWSSGRIDTTCEYVEPYLKLIEKYNIPPENLNWTVPLNWKATPSVGTCGQNSLVTVGLPGGVIP